MREDPKQAGIKEIAKALSISIGTVDRALHGRHGVSPKTADRVRKMANQLGYQPNAAARALKLNRHFRVGVHLPQEISSFFDPLAASIADAARSPSSFRVDLELHRYRRLGDGDVELLEKMFSQKHEKPLDALLITPGDPARVDALINRIVHTGTAVVCVASDAPRTTRLATVSVDAYTSGCIAAELFARTIPTRGVVATITGDLTTLDHVDKLRGFAAALATMAPHLSLLPAIESHERPKEAYRQTVRLLEHKPRPIGLYISTANSLPVLQAIKEHNLAGKIKVVTTDLFSALVPFIDSGVILATLHQRPCTQAKVAFELTTQFLVNRIQPKPVTKLAPHIILRSNLPLFAEELTRVDLDMPAEA